MNKNSGVLGSARVTQAGRRKKITDKNGKRQWPEKKRMETESE